jgi:2'-5' RNA ligase
MRLFIAVPLPVEVKEALFKLREPIEGVRWRNPEQMHLTLKFLGDTPRQEINQLQKELNAITADPFSVDLEGAGQFPLTGPPRVLWVGVASNNQLIQLHKEVEQLCSNIGFPPEDRDFYPHITLGRVTDGTETEVESLIERYSDFQIKDIPVDRVVLYESQLQPDGAVHNPLKIFRLG